MTERMKTFFVVVAAFVCVTLTVVASSRAITPSQTYGQKWATKWNTSHPSTLTPILGINCLRVYYGYSCRVLKYHLTKNQLICVAIALNKKGDIRFSQMSSCEDKKSGNPYIT